MANINDKLLNGYSNWTPSNSYLAMSTMALNQFWYKCNQSSVLDAFSKGFTQPLNYINFIRVYPFNVMGRTYEETDVPVHVANQFINVPNNRTDAVLKDSHVGNINPRIHETYTFNFDAKTKFTDYEPYTTCECFLPYVGFITLAPSELVGVIQVDLIIDVISGNGTYCISRGGHVIYTVQTNFSVDIPLGGTNNIEQFKAQFNNGISALMGIGMTALGVGTGNTFLTSQGIGNSVNAITNIPNSNTSHMIKRGTLGNYSTNFNNPHSIYFIFKKRNINDYDGFIETYGKPLNKKVKLSNITGMTFIPNPKLEIEGITSDEYDILRGLLKNGVIIGNGLNVSDIRLNGKYKLLDKISVTNVKLNGLYDEFKVKVNNIKLKGTYNLLDKLIVTNVKLKGLYDEYKVKVNNIALNGTYLVQPKIEVSNVVLSGSYDEYKIKVSNVALSGIYNIMHNIEVSNVALKGTYEQEISNYTLTINFYKDSSLYNTITQEYASGTTISPASIATEYLPTDYEVDTTSPTSDFVITEDTTLSVYYKAQSGEITDLTGYTWTGNDTINFVRNQYDFYNINFTSIDINFIGFLIDWDGGDESIWYYSTSSSRVQTYLGENNISWWVYEIGCKTIQITGGTDATNTELIAWLQENGTLTKT